MIKNNNNFNNNKSNTSQNEWLLIIMADLKKSATTNSKITFGEWQLLKIEEERRKRDFKKDSWEKRDGSNTGEIYH